MNDLTARLLDHAAEAGRFDRAELYAAAPHPYTREAQEGIAECLEVLGQLADVIDVIGVVPCGDGT
jgi:hypothetical protein